ncbi:PKS-NRPS hybrid synthetase cheA-like [Vicia villosa]|uniref:PKS-NRPS hybrid synthetase cheA-like n=1 Tax=Vicia villosa TaxID=3911 RepID=UPI00273A87B6|nr:PKS-NRPS hybrid synthetase cheA-like [Vicia villosa]
MQQLFKLVEESGYVYWSRKKDESEVVRDIFGAYPESVKLLNLFPIVLIMDCIYKTNKYIQPLFEIVGMTSTKLTFVVASAYMEFEQRGTFCWVLDKLKQLFIKQDFCPQVILTDRYLALMNAIETIFSKTTNFLCRFHINKNVKSKCKDHVVDNMRETVEKMWYELIRAGDEMMYHQKLKQLEDVCVDSKDFINYVIDTWLTPHRHRFVKAWVNQVLHLGNTTTNRVEFAYWKLKQMLKNNLGDLCKCWEAMNDNIKIQVGNIRASFQKSFYEVKHAHTSPFYANLRGSVSRFALRQIIEEWLRIDMVGTNTKKCRCTHRKIYGLPCACELGRYTLSGDAIPIEAIHIHWRKLSMEDYIRPFIDDIVDVRDHGNCGFRAIASLNGYGTDGWSMVRRDLEKEIISPRSKLYEELFGYPSLSYFPKTSAHSPNASIYCIGFVNGNHWVQVNMNEGFLLPPVTTDWKKYRTKDATSWMVGFAGRLQHWQHLTPILPKYVRL